MNTNENEKSVHKYTGGYKQNKSVSWEASHTSFGISEENSVDSYSINGKLSLNSGKNVKTSLKVGVHRWEQDVQEYYDNGIDLFYGLDVKIPISEHVSANMNVDSYEIDDESLNKISLELIFKF